MLKSETSTAAPVAARDRAPGRARWLALLLPAAILLAAGALVDLPAVGGALAALAPGVLALALLLATVDRFVMAYKWRHLVLAGDAELRYSKALRVHYQAAASGRVVPAPLAADVLRGWLAVRAGVPEGVALSSIVLEKLVSLLVSIVVAFLGLLYLVGSLPPQTNVGALFGLLAVALLAGLAALALVLLSSLPGIGVRAARRWLRPGPLSGRSLSRRLGSPSRWLGSPSRWLAPLSRRFGKALSRVSAALSCYRSRKAALLVNGLLGLGEYGVQLSKLLVLAMGVGIGLPALSFVAVAAVMLFVRRVSGTMESWGLGEGSAVLVLVLLGVEAELAVALLVANFAVSTVAVLPGALLFYGSAHPGERGRRSR